MYKDILKELEKFDDIDEDGSLKPRRRSKKEPESSTLNAIGIFHDNTIIPPEVKFPFHPLSFSLAVFSNRIELSFTIRRWTRVIPIHMSFRTSTLSFTIPAKLKDGSYYGSLADLMILVDRDDDSYDVTLLPFNQHKTYRNEIDLRIKIKRRDK